MGELIGWIGYNYVQVIIELYGSMLLKQSNPSIFSTKLLSAKASVDQNLVLKILKKKKTPQLYCKVKKNFMIFLLDTNQEPLERAFQNTPFCNHLVVVQSLGIFKNCLFMI